jgi:putative holliday junction resolvase
MEMLHPALGIDHGEARIGLASTDALGILAFPIKTIPAQEPECFHLIASEIQQRHIKTIVLGLPLRMDGSEGTAAQKVRAFGERLLDFYPQAPLIYWDETYTTHQAAEKLRQAGKKAKQQKAIIDQAAAVEILQSWMRAHQEIPYFE